MNIYIDTLGCAKNEYDSQMLSASLREKDFILTSDPEDADVIIVNTCGFIEDAKKESIDRIFELADSKRDDAKLVVTGCLSERYHNELSEEMPEVDMFFGVNDYDVIPEILSSSSSSASAEEHVARGQYDKEGASDICRRDMVGDDIDDLRYRIRDFEPGSYYGYLKIAEGCNNACTFCAIPAIRGRFRSKKMEDCIREASDMAAAGIKELILIAQDTSQYGSDLYGRLMLPELLRKLCSVEGIRWIRLMYVYDNGITDELIRTIAEEDKICNYIDMPIQHVSDPVLRRMGRRSTGASIRETIARLRAGIPDVHIRTTLLTGFPGETEEDMHELLSFIDTMKIDRVGAFAFSDEDGTPSSMMDGKIDEAVRQSRRDAVMEHQLEVSRALNAMKTGKIYDVIIDEMIEPGVYTGRTRYDSPEIDCEVSFTGGSSHVPGDIVKVRIMNTFEYDLEGEEVL